MPVSARCVDRLIDDVFEPFLLAAHVLRIHAVCERVGRERFERIAARENLAAEFRVPARVTLVAELIEASKGWSAAGREGVLDRRGETYGIRDLLWRSSEVRRLAESPELKELVEPILGPRAFAVRGLYFDKTPETNWNLPWHQDLTIAVRSRREAPGFGPWTLKAGIPHVNAPAELLARMMTVRLHLDDCGPESGPMRVLRG